MKKLDWLTYIKLFLGISLTFPLNLAFWDLDFDFMSAFKIAGCIHLSLFTLGVMLLNYLETGNCFKKITKI